MKRARKQEDELEPAMKRKTGKIGHWSLQLLTSMENPKLIVQSDEAVVVIKDAYPKARHHYLVLPRADISSLKSVNASHVPLLKRILKSGMEVVERVKEKEPNVRFQLGYHAIASMSRLHMHVISQDFDSPCLKTKKHWNSFTSDFFVNAEQVISMLESSGKVCFNTEQYERQLKLPLKCHVCQVELPNMPKLKSHLSKHNAP